MGIAAAVGLLGAVVSAAPAAALETVRYRAAARDLRTGEALYTEHHVERWVGGAPVTGEVEYRDPEGRTFARKRLDYRPGAAAPDFELVDQRSGFREGAVREPEGVGMFVQPEGGAPVSRRTVVPPGGADVVIDAGFHRFVVSRWDELMTGRPVEVAFAVPSEGRFFRFRIVVAGAGTFRGLPVVKLRMKPASLFLRAFVDPVQLTYGRDGRLWVFEGTTNLPAPGGSRYRARIVFDRPPPGLAGLAQDTSRVGR